MNDQPRAWGQQPDPASTPGEQQPPEQPRPWGQQQGPAPVQPAPAPVQQPHWGQQPPPSQQWGQPSQSQPQQQFPSQPPQQQVSSQPQPQFPSQPQPQQWQPSPQFAPPPPRRPARTGLILGLAGGGVLVVAAIIAVVALVVVPILVPKHEQSATGTSGDGLADMATKPVVAWTRSLTLGNPSKWIAKTYTARVGGTGLVAYQAFDAETFVKGSEWSLSYTQDYALGYSRGTEYRKDEAAGKSPSIDEYYGGSTDYFSATLGAHTQGEFALLAGFQAGMDGDPSRPDAVKQPQPDPDFHPKARMFGPDGRVLWTIDFERQAKGADWRSTILAQPTPDGSRVLFTVIRYDDPEMLQTELLLVDAKTGETIAKRVGDNYVAAAITDDAVFTTSPEVDHFELRRYPLTSLTKPTWSVESQITTLDPKVLGDDVIVENQNSDQNLLKYTGSDLIPTGVVYSGKDGAKRPWGSDMGGAVAYNGKQIGYDVVGGTVIRREYRDADSTWEVAGIDQKTGRKLWSANTGYLAHADGQLYLAAPAGNGVYDHLRRVDPKTGKDVWSSPFAGDVVAVEARNADALVISGPKDYIALDPKTGKEISRYADAESGKVVMRQEQYYMTNTAGVWTVPLHPADGDAEPLWTYPFHSRNQTLVSAGSTIVVFDDTARKLYGLGER